MPENTVRIGVEVIGRDQIKQLANDFLGASHAAQQLVRTDLKRIGQGLTQALKPFERTEVFNKFEQALDKAVNAPNVQALDKIKTAAAELGKEVGGPLGNSFIEFSKKAEEGLKAPIRAIDDLTRRISLAVKELRTGDLKGVIQEGLGGGGLPASDLKEGAVLQPVSRGQVDKLRLGLEELQGQNAFPQLEAQIASAIDQLAGFSSELQLTKARADEAAAVILSGLIPSLQQTSTELSTLSGRSRAALNELVVSLQKAASAAEGGRLSAQGLGVASVRAADALREMGQASDDDSDATKNLRREIEQINQVMKEQQTLLQASRNEERKREKQQRGAIVRGRAEQKNLKALQSVLQGFITGQALLKGQVIFAAFGFVFAHATILRLMVAAAALTLIIDGLRRAFQFLTKEVIKAGGALLDQVAKLENVTGSVKEAAAAYALAEDMSRRFNLSQQELADGFVRLHQEGLVIRPLMEGIAKAAAGLNLSPEDVAQRVSQGIGTDQGSLESLNEILGVTAFRLAAAHDESDRTTRAFAVADALNAQFANAQTIRARTLTGATKGLTEEIKRLLGVMGAPFIQEVLVPLISGLTDFVEIMTETTKSFFASEHAANQLKEILANMKTFVDLLFPSIESFNGQMKAWAFFLNLTLNGMIMTTRALVLFGHAIRFVASMVGKLFQLVKPLIDALRRLFQFLKSLIDPAFVGALKDFFGNLPAIINNALSNILVALDGFLKPFFQALDDFIDDLVDRTPRLKKAWDDFIGVLNIDTLRNLLDDIIEAFNKFMRALTRGIDSLRGIPRAFRAFSDEILESLSPARFREAFDEVAETIFSFGRKLARAGDDIPVHTNNILGAMRRFITNLSTDILPSLQKVGLRLTAVLDNLVLSFKLGGTKVTITADDIIDVDLKSFDGTFDDVGQGIGKSLDTLVIDITKKSGEAGEATSKSFLRSMDKATVDMVTGAVKLSIHILSIPFRLINPLAWPGLIKEAFKIITFPATLLSALAPEKIMDDIAGPLGKSSDDLVRGVVDTLLHPNRWIRALTRGGKSLIRGGFVFFFVDLLGSVLIDEIIDNDVWSGVAQVFWGVLIGAIAGGAVAGIAASPTGPGAIVAALVGAVVGGLLSLAVELGLNPAFREAANKMGMAVATGINEAIGDAFGSIGIDGSVLGGAFDGIADAITEPFKDLDLSFDLGPAGDALDEMAEALKEPIQDIKDNLAEAQKAFEDFGQGIVDFATNPLFMFLINQLDNLARILALVITPPLIILGQTFRLFARVLAEALVPIINNLIDILEEGLAPAIKLVTGLLLLFLAPIELITAVFINFIGLIGNLLSGDWADAWLNAEAIFEAFREYLTDTLEALLKIFEGTFELLWVIIKNIFEAGFEVIVGVVTGGTEELIQIFTELPGTIGDLTEKLFKEVTGWFDDMYQEIIGTDGSVTNLATDILRAFGDLIIDVTTTIFTFFTKTVPGWYMTLHTLVIGTVREIRDEVIAFFKDIASWMLDNTFIFFTSTVPGWFTSLYDQLLGPSGVVKNIKTEVIAAFEGIGTVVDRVFTNLGRPVKAGLQKVIDPINKTINGFKDFINGIKSAVNWVSGKLGIGDIIPGSIPRDLKTIPTLAMGSAAAIGGPTIVGEQGPELVTIPAGSSVLSNTGLMELKRMFKGNVPAIGGPFDVVPNPLDVASDLGSLGLDVITAPFELLAKEAAKFLVNQALSLFGIDKPDLPGVMSSLGGAIFGKIKDGMIKAVTSGFEVIKAAVIDNVKDWEHPLNNRGTVTQEFGLTPFSSVYTDGLHKGIDIGADAGTPVLAAATGTALLASSQSAYGNMVLLKHADEMYSLYAHMRSIAVGVLQTVQKGDLVGQVGSTGMSTGNHLHFEAHRGFFDRIDPREMVNFASGGFFGKGGLASLGEQGREMAILPSGTQILNNAQTMQLLSSLSGSIGGGGITMINEYHISGSVVGEGGMVELAETVTELQMKRLRPYKFDMLRG